MYHVNKPLISAVAVAIIYMQFGNCETFKISTIDSMFKVSPTGNHESDASVGP